MRQKIIRVGNSSAVTIPKEHLKELGWKIGDRVISTFETKNKLLIVTKVNEKLEQWLKKIVKKNRKMLTELAKYD